jgi:hypothetical protein
MPRKGRTLRVAPAAAGLFDFSILDGTNGLIISAGRSLGHIERSEKMTCEVGGVCHRVTLTLPSPIKGEDESTPPSPLAGEGRGEGWVPESPEYFSSFPNALKITAIPLPLPANRPKAAHP